MFVFTAAVHLGACEAAQHPRFVVVVVVVVVVVIGAAAGEDGCVSGEDEDEEGCGGGGDEQASWVAVASAVVCHHHQNGACSEGCSQHPRLTVVLAGGKTAAEADAEEERVVEVVEVRLLQRSQTTVTEARQALARFGTTLLPTHARPFSAAVVAVAVAAFFFELAQTRMSWLLWLRRLHHELLLQKDRVASLTTFFCQAAFLFAAMLLVVVVVQVLRRRRARASFRRRAPRGSTASFLA